MFNTFFFPLPGLAGGLPAPHQVWQLNSWWPGCAGPALSNGAVATEFGLAVGAWHTDRGSKCMLSAVTESTIKQRIRCQGRRADCRLAVSEVLGKKRRGKVRAPGINFSFLRCWYHVTRHVIKDPCIRSIDRRAIADTSERWV